VGFAQPFDLNLADKLTHPLTGLRLFGGEPDARRGLRQHDLGEMPVQILKLGLALEAQHHRIAALAGLGDGGVKLRQLLQARQLVDDKPHPPLRLRRLIQQPQNQPINP
jgi:hypothetical protein